MPPQKKSYVGKIWKNDQDEDEDFEKDRYQRNKTDKKKNRKRHNLMERESSESSIIPPRRRGRKRGKGRDPDEYPLSSSEILKSGSMASGHINTSQSH